jgi:hypothetical protein
MWIMLTDALAGSTHMKGRRDVVQIKARNVGPRMALHWFRTFC